MDGKRAWIMVGTALTVVVMVLGLAGLPALAPRVSAAQPDAGSGAPQMQGEVAGRVVVVGEGSVKLQPDVAQANIGVEVTDSTVRAASTAAAELMTGLLEALTGAGVAQNDIQTSGYNVYADRGFGPTGPEGEIVYRVSNNVTVIIRDLEKVGEVLDAAIDAGANNIFGVTFSLEDSDAAESAARAEAVANAQAKAEELAALTGLELGRVISVSEIIGSSGGFFAGGVRESMALGMGGGGPISPGQLEIVVQLEVTYDAR